MLSISADGTFVVKITSNKQDASWKKLICAVAGKLVAEMVWIEKSSDDPEFGCDVVSDACCVFCFSDGVSIEIDCMRIITTAAINPISREPYLNALVLMVRVAKIR